MSKAAKDTFNWARRVSRTKVRRLYESDAAGMLDLDLLDEVGYGMVARCKDMFDIWQSQRGRVPCRGCRTILARHGIDKAQVLCCPQCGWQVTWGEYYDSYSGKRILPGSATEVFRRFVEAWPTARTPAAKMQAIDRLIHEFHVNHGIDGRPTGENVIQGSTKQVVALIEELAYGTGSTALPANKETWQTRFSAPMRTFRRAHSWAKVQAIARELGIQGLTPRREDDIVREIMERDPGRFENG